MWRDRTCSYRIINLLSDVVIEEYETWWDAVDAYIAKETKKMYAIFIDGEVGHYKMNASGDIVNVITGAKGSTDKEIFLHIAEKTYDAAHNN